MLSSGIILLALAISALGSPTRRAMAVHEQRAAADVPSAFSKLGDASPDHLISFRVGLTPKDIAGLETALYAVSEPDSAKFGQHLSLEEVKAFAGPTPETVAAVTEWLSDNEITEVSTSGAFDDYLTFSIPVSKANTLLNAKFESFVHTPTGSKRVRTLSYSLPTDLFAHIDMVHPTTAFDKPLVGRPPMVSIPLPPSALESNVTGRALPAPSSCNSVVTPACLQALYGIPATKATQSSAKLAVSGFIDQFAQTADLRTFLTRLRTDIPSTTTFTVQSLDGGVNTQGASQAGIEANLDIQYTVGVATGVPVTFITVGENTQDGALDGFLDIINLLNGESAPPQVLTTSYGFDETDISSADATRLCNAYMALGARGVSILFASGDGGVAGGQSQSCTTFIPAFPGGCAFHTSVGATQGTTETSASFSSGGFSRVFTRPSYQATAVSTYLTALGSTNSGKFTATGRGFPDVAAQGVNVEIVDGGSIGTVAGTSCSSPIFASVIALINDRRIAAGKSSLGFLNPFLYANPGAFFDITTGSNPGCGTNGFPARAGWDPVTGLGTPNFASLLTAALALP
ncbi:family S53 protease-like protein [Mycena floridula]|nr:family S53 protease-like protein [Mycena floridula]